MSRAETGAPQVSATGSGARRVPAARVAEDAVVGSDETIGDGRAGVSASRAGEAPAEIPVPGSEAPAARKPWAGWERVIRISGLAVAVLAAIVSGFLEISLSTLRAGDLVTVWSGDAIGSGGGPLLGVSILLAGVLNYVIAWFAVSTTRRRWALGPPWALWTLLMLGAAGVRTSEGDYLLGGENWIALVMILVGSLTYAVYSYRLILRRSLP